MKILTAGFEYGACVDKTLDQRLDMEAIAIRLDSVPKHEWGDQSIKQAFKVRADLKSYFGIVMC